LYVTNTRRYEKRARSHAAQQTNNNKKRYERAPVFLGSVRCGTAAEWRLLPCLSRRPALILLTVETISAGRRGLRLSFALLLFPYTLGFVLVSSALGSQFIVHMTTSSLGTLLLYV
jgi:hypothetical protein